jgi:acetylornithine/succinyldiaminopimelate/putrescine aminotransferase
LRHDDDPDGTGSPLRRGELRAPASRVARLLQRPRRWGYRAKGISAGQARIIACEANFHGRTLGGGLELEPDTISARAVCEALLERGILARETRSAVLRLAPPLVVERAQIDTAVEQLRLVLTGRIAQSQGRKT